MNTRLRVLLLLVLGVAVAGWNAAIAAPPIVVTAPLTASTASSVTSVNASGASAFLPPAGGQMVPGGVGGQLWFTQPGGQLMPGSAPGGQLAPGTITGGTAPILTPGSPIFRPRSTITNYGLPITSNPTVIVTGNSPTTVAGGMISGNGVGGNSSRVIVTGGNAAGAPGGAISGNGVGGSRVIVTGNGVATPGQSSVIVTGNGLTGAGVGGTNPAPALR